MPAGDNRANLVWIDDHDVLTAAQASGEDGLRATFLEKCSGSSATSGC